MAARIHAQRKAFGWPSFPDTSKAEVEKLARRAAVLGKDDAVALTMAGIALGYFCGDLDSADSLITRALSLNPNLASAWLFGGWVKVWAGESEAALERLAHALRLSPQDPQMFNIHTAIAAAHMISGDFEKAQSDSAAAVENQPNYALAYIILAASAAHRGHLVAAQRAVQELLQIKPGFTATSVADMFPARNTEYLANLVDGLRKAGLQG
jgi:tetratricopeptide (TPR) repeat protein